MNKNALVYNSDEELSGKQLYQRSFNNRLRGEVQPNIGRIQQAGAKSYRESYLAGTRVYTEFRWPELTRLPNDIKTAVLCFLIGEDNLSGRSWLQFSVFSETDYFPGPVRGWSVPAQEERHSAEGFLDRARRLDHSGHTDAALDLIYENVNGKLSRGRFNEVNSVLETTEPMSLSVDLMLGLLTSTLPAKTKLPSRGTFFQRSEAAIKGLNEWEDGLLTGLEN